MGPPGNHLQLDMGKDVECRWETEMTPDERTKIMNQYRAEAEGASSEYMYLWLNNAMWLAVLHPFARKNSIVQKAHQMTRISISNKQSG